jgi:predicted MFS family arabinose efflux permease
LGLDWIATVPPTLRLTADAVGSRDAPVAFGWIFAAHQVGAGMGALGAGVIRTRWASYDGAWLAAGAICILAAALVLRIGRSRAEVAVRMES